ncbi:molybdopterin-guanine dinucleotide biosynthesis protein B [bacterium]|nr:molybdopterin-guanine dinucleotide biosynthesis protein B [bacterium]
MTPSAWQHHTVLAVSGIPGSGRADLMHQLATALAKQSINVALVIQEQNNSEPDRKREYSLALTSKNKLELHLDLHDGLEDTLRLLAPLHDLVLVEGDATTSLPKLWLDHPDEAGTKQDADLVLEQFAPGASRLPATLSFVQNWLMSAWINRPVMVAIHRATAHSEENDSSLLHHVALVTNLSNRDDTLLLDFPTGDDLPGGEALLRTLRSRPGSAWLLAGTEDELPDEERMKTLFEARRPGRWIIGFVADDKTLLPLLLEPQAIPILEHFNGELDKLLQHPCFYPIVQAETAE